MVFPIEVKGVDNELWVWDIQPVADGELVDMIEELCSMGQVDHEETIFWNGGEIVCSRAIHVMVMEAPTSFSLFSPTNCTLYSHFSFNNFVMIAFPDLTRDLDDLI